MSSKLDALKAAFAPAQKTEIVYTKYFDFWKIKTGEQAEVRFLKDANPDNPRQFVVENLTHSFKINGKKRVVACLSMYGKPCPACEVSRDYYAQAEKAGEPSQESIVKSNGAIKPGPLTVIGKSFYRKKEYIGQVKIQNSPIDYEKNEGHEHEMPISIGPQIFKLIQAAFSSGDLDEVPYEVKGGYDFRIVKSDQGGQANYTLSKFVPKPSDLSDDVIANLNLFDLSTLRNREVSPETIQAMIVAQQTGEPLVLPNQNSTKADGDSAFTESSDVASAVTSTSTSTVADTSTETTGDTPNKVNDVLAQIRARAAAKAAAA